MLASAFFQRLGNICLQRGKCIIAEADLIVDFVFQAVAILSYSPPMLEHTITTRFFGISWVCFLF